MNLDTTSHTSVRARDGEGPADSGQGPTPWRSWLIDLTLGYLGGLTIGAPIGLLTARYFDIPTAIDLVTVAVMILVVASLRARRTHTTAADRTGMTQTSNDTRHQPELETSLAQPAGAGLFAGQRPRRRA